MPVETVLELPPVNELNNVKDKMAQLYVDALNSLVNYTSQPAGRAVDNMGIDYVIYSFPVGSERTVASGANEINIQLKGTAEDSTSKFSEDVDSIRYKLNDPIVRVGMSMYLFVVVLPGTDEFNSWRTINESDVLFRARAYYLKVDNEIRGWVTIPKTNKLTQEAYMSLFKNADDEVAI